jgi:hypothetical protein
MVGGVNRNSLGVLNIGFGPLSRDFFPDVMITE